MPPQTERFLIDSFKNDEPSFFGPSSTPDIPSGQIKNYREDEMDIERIYQSDLESYKASQEGLAEQDRLAEESFEKLFDTESIPENAKTRRKMLKSTVDKYVKGDHSDEEKQRIYKERLHGLWSDLGKPLVEFEAHGDHGEWTQGNKKDFIQPVRWIDPPESEKVEDWNQYFTELSDKSIYEKAFDRYGEAEFHDSWDESNKYRQDKIKINDEEKGKHRWRTFLEELSHQMQGRKLHGQDIAKMRSAVNRQINIDDRYYNPRALEAQAHRVYTPILKKYLKGDDKYIDIIKSKSWGEPNLKYQHFLHEDLGLPKEIRKDYEIKYDDGGSYIGYPEK